MKQLVILLIFIGISSILTAQTSHFVITGKIEGADNVRFLLLSSENGRLIQLDSATAREGTFRMSSGNIGYPRVVNLLTEDRKRMLSFYLENSNITITGRIDSLETARVTGSKTQDEVQELTRLMKPLGEMYQTKNKDLTKARRTGDDTKIKNLSEQINLLMTQATIIEKEFILNHPKSFAVPEILNSIASEISASEMESIINKLDPEVAKTPIILNIRFKLDILKSVDIGKKAPDFTLFDPDGYKVTLSSKTGSKLLLLDFWAGWCGPCRSENPNVVKVYNEFHNKGFDIIGISLDQTASSWTKAISDDKLTWTHVSDLQYWNSAVAKLYGVSSIPANFLLDKNGVIIAKNLRGEALYNTIKELINK